MVAQKTVDSMNSTHTFAFVANNSTKRLVELATLKLSILIKNSHGHGALLFF